MKLLYPVLHNYCTIYRNYPSLFWSDYGFRTINLEENKVRSDLEAIHHGIVAVMLENGKSNLIWKLFSQDEDIKKIVNALFE